jgi:DNA-binding NarL/FixJ family response regulator
MKKQPSRILLVEDNPADIALLMATVFSRATEFTVVAAGRLSAVAEAAARETFDLALLDLGLPDSKGLETIRKAQEALPGLPIIVLTGQADEHLGLEAIRAGAHDYLVKGGISGESLGRAIRYALERSRTEEALRQANISLEHKVRERTAELAARAAQLRALAGELTLSEQRERRRMAKVLHDHLQQLLVGAKFRTAILGRKAEPLVKQAALEIEGLLDEAVSVSRSLTAELSPPVLHEGGLSAGLEWLAHWMADKHGLIVELSMEAGLPPLAEDVKVLLFESVRELLFNAIKHAHVGSARVNLRLIEESQLRITVSDAGPGFDPTKVKPAGEAGGGFGLFSIRERLDLIGGHVEIDSAPGKGSRFMLTAPIKEAAETQPLVVPAAGQAVADRPAVQVSSPKLGAPVRVLLADDHVVMREGLARLLSQEPDIQVVGEAADGQQAVELAGKLLPDVILMDMSMPRLNGVEATRAIHHTIPDIRIIGLSMFEEAERAAAMRGAGAVAYLTKSGPSADVIAAIRACMTRQPAKAEPVAKARKLRRRP